METQSFQTPGPLSLKVEVPAGLVEVQAMETETTEIGIERAKRLEDYVVRFDDLPAGGHRLSVEYRGRKTGFLFAKDVLIDVRCPSGTSVEVSSGSADLVARGRMEAIAFRAGSGDLSFDDVDGDVSAKSASGDVQGGVVGGDFTMNAASGDVRLAGVGGDVTVKTISGDLAVGPVGGDVTIQTVSGDVELDSLSVGLAAIRSVSGDVRVGVAAGTGVLLDLSATTGDATSDLDMNGGGAASEANLELRVTTVSGDIRVLRAPARPSKIG
jgi:hypothetical protein